MSQMSKGKPRREYEFLAFILHFEKDKNIRGKLMHDYVKFFPKSVLPVKICQKNPNKVMERWFEKKENMLTRFQGGN